ncbi:MAG: tRNA (N6-threonylcarbamoyladenosine(37)-N6)-methyltransferase TrmO [Anaerolineales bacterium]
MDFGTITYQPIGIIYSPFKDITGVPIQPSAAVGVRGRVEIQSRFQPGLKDLEGFSHVILLYHFDRVDDIKLRVTPFLDDEERGVFATRAPLRPNPIGLSIVKLIEIRGNILEIENVDVVDQSPLLDLKPYVPYFDRPEGVKSGWIEKAKDQVKGKRGDDRFA